MMADAVGKVLSVVAVDIILTDCPNRLESRNIVDDRLLWYGYVRG